MSDYFHFWSASASISVALFRLDLVITRPWFATFSRTPPMTGSLQGRINLRFNNRDHHGGLHKAVLNGKEADVEQLLSSGKGN